MSDNDLIRRGEVLALLNTTSQEEITDESYDRLYNAVALMNPVPQPMSAVKFGSTLLKICASHNGCCSECEINRPCAIPDRFNVPIVEKWAKEHPERSEE